MKEKDSLKNKDTPKNIDSYAHTHNLTANTDHNYDVGNPVLTEENKHLYGNNSNLYTKEYFPKQNEIDNIKNSKE